LNTSHPTPALGGLPLAPWRGLGWARAFPAPPAYDTPRHDTTRFLSYQRSWWIDGCRPRRHWINRKRQRTAAVQDARARFGSASCWRSFWSAQPSAAL